ncbi:hypothetical protein, partial [Salmonella enterica]|uniref:hypothetical protein n=1 Tax=Salmonella enterica TaxID=28901 RepID=UPI00191C1623
MTEDHKIFTHSWKQAKQLVSNKYMMDRALEIGMDAWLSCASYQNDKAKDNYSSNVIVERCLGGSIMTMSGRVKPLNATAAPLKQQKNIVNSISATKTQCRMMRTERDYSTGCPRRSREQQAPGIRVIKTMGQGASRYSTSGGLIKGRFLD